MSDRDKASRDRLGIPLLVLANVAFYLYFLYACLRYG
jgi:hypothetical protein